MSSLGDKEGGEKIIKMTGSPSKNVGQKERFGFKAFVKLFVRWFTENDRRNAPEGSLVDDYVQGNVLTKTSDISEIAEEAAFVSSRTKLNNAKTTKLLFSELNDILKDKNIAEEIKPLQLELLAKQHPDVAPQLEKIAAMYAHLRVTKGLAMELRISDSGDFQVSLSTIEEEK